MEDTELGPTLGAGLRTRVGDTKVQADYAWAGHQRLEGTHRFTVGVSY